MRALVERLGARYEPHPRPLGLNVARNTGVERSTGELVVFVDDDVRVRPGWLRALLDAARAHPEVDVFTGPIEPCLEGWRRVGDPLLRSRGTADHLARSGRPGHGHALRLGRQHDDSPRRPARVGPFEVALEYGGDEQEWQDRLRAGDTGRPRPVRGRRGARASPRRLGRAASIARARRLLAWARQPPLRRLSRRGAVAWTRAAHARGLPRACAPPPLPRRAGDGCAQRRAPAREPARAVGPPRAPARLPQDDFLSRRQRHGRWSRRDPSRHAGRDHERLGARQRAAFAPGIAARRDPPRRKVLVLGVERPEHRALAQGIRDELLRSRHDVELRIGPPGELGKFENLNRLLAGGVDGADGSSIAGGLRSRTTIGCW